MCVCVFERDIYCFVNSKAMAVSSSFVVTPKLETLLSNHHNPSSSSSPAPSGLIGIRALPMDNRTRRGLIQRARCEISSSKAASISALEQLKTSALDSTKFLPFFFLRFLNCSISSFGFFCLLFSLLIAFEIRDWDFR